MTTSVARAGDRAEGPRAADLLLLVRSLEDDALVRLTAATGTTSVCADARRGPPPPGAKYHEGAASALAEVRRAITGARRLGPPCERDEVALVRQVRAQWRAGQARPATPVWLAHRAGGVEALDELVAAVVTPRSGPVSR